MNKPRRSTDLDEDDLTCLIRLCETRLHTINLHLRKHSINDAANTSYLKAASQVAISLDKLRALKERTAH